MSAPYRLQTPFHGLNKVRDIISDSIFPQSSLINLINSFLFVGEFSIGLILGLWVGVSITLVQLYSNPDLHKEDLCLGSLTG